MRIAGIIGGAVLAVMGAVWALQGVNSRFAPRSFMTGSGTWVVIGLCTLIAGVVLMVRSWRRR